MNVGDLVYMTDKFYHSYLSGDHPHRSGIVIRKYRAWVDPFMVEDSDPSMDGHQYDCVFGSTVINGLLWGWEITEVRQNECR
ncbi:MAG: hypothetical protein GOVbin703_181 [Prokaryotic dsDNA virus sp.]|nr:MAG: hypothetical protein GOVbin703_181 [Prokaryotic dsDNA virus sp.]